MTGSWNSSAMLNASTVAWYESSTSHGAMTARGVSPWLAKTACSRSDCSLFVGRPVDGPPRCTLTITAGTSAIDERPSISAISERPGPDVAVIDFTPANDAPMTAPIAESSSSVCSAVPPSFGSHSASMCRISDDGVIG